MRSLKVVLFALVLSCRAISVPPSPSAAGDMTIGRTKLCVTEGAIEERSGGRLSVNVPKMRAFVTIATSDVVDARFTYLGPTSQEARLASGAARRQFGLKLRARDGCNVVYAMWRIEPESKLVVSVKSNPGMHKSSECGNAGYQNIKPRRSSSVPRLKPGDTHTLRAEMHGQEMTVSVDGVPLWEGDVGPASLKFTGPVGLRSDNTRLEIELRVQADGNQTARAFSCPSGDSESE